jgi:hypothetical protein
VTINKSERNIYKEVEMQHLPRNSFGSVTVDKFKEEGVSYSLRTTLSHLIAFKEQCKVIEEEENHE